MSGFILKLSAMIFMVIDHSALALYNSGIIQNENLYIFLRGLGRPAFPVFCFLLAEGFYKTSSREKYFIRLCRFAVISQIPFCLVGLEENYVRGAAAAFGIRPEALLLIIPLAVYFIYSCQKKFRPELFWLAAALFLGCVDFSAGGIFFLSSGHLNVFYTLACALACMQDFEILSSDCGKEKTLLCALAVLIAVFVLQQNADYGFEGLIFALLLYRFHGRKKKSVLICAACCLALYLPSVIIGDIAYLPMPVLSLISPLMIAFYNGSRGPKLRTAFYLVYPVHLALLALFFVIL